MKVARSSPASGDALEGTEGIPVPRQPQPRGHSPRAALSDPAPLAGAFFPTPAEREVAVTAGRPGALSVFVPRRQPQDPSCPPPSEAEPSAFCADDPPAGFCLRSVFMSPRDIRRGFGASGLHPPWWAAVPHLWGLV